MWGDGKPDDDDAPDMQWFRAARLAFARLIEPPSEAGPHRPRRRGRAASIVAAMVTSAMIAAAPAEASASVFAPPGNVVVAEDLASEAAEANEAEVAKAVDQHEQAFLDVDCELFRQVTTQTYRERMGLDECAAFEEQARQRADLVESVELVTESVEGMGRGRSGALVHMEYRGYRDAEGEPVDSPVLLEYDFRYHLARIATTWRIDAVHDVTGGRTENTATAEDEANAAETMDHWREAFMTGDCDHLAAATTAGFREGNGWADCAAFTRTLSEREAHCPGASIRQEDIRFHTNVDPHSGEIIVDVVISCTYGEPSNPDYEYGFPYRYHLVDEGGEWRIAEAEDGASAEDEPGNANERAAIETMRAYNQAWIDEDCDAFLATTTSRLRETLGLADCEAFGSAALDYGAYVTNFTLTPTDIERPSPVSMQIKAHERWQEPIDAQGQPVNPPYELDEYYVYELGLVKGEWLLTDVYLLL